MTESASPLDDPRALQILITEYNGLASARSLAYNEAFARAGMFLTFLSASLIVIGFLVGGQAVSDVLPIVVVLLLADFYVGVVTLGRLIGASGEELNCVRGMNRIRHAFHAMTPGIERYFVTAGFDDVEGVLSAYGNLTSVSDQGVASNLMHGLSTTVAMIATIDTLILGAIAAVIAIGLGAGTWLAVLVGFAVFVVAFGSSAAIAMRFVQAQQRAFDVRFPRPPAE